MLQITDLTLLTPGDVLHHGDAGLAIVDVSEDGRFEAVAAGPGERATWDLTPEAQRDGWGWCVPGGLLWRRARDPDGLRPLAGKDPLQTLRLLLDDIDGPLTMDGARAALVGHQLVRRSRFSAWWTSALAQLAKAPDLAWDGQHLSRRGLDPSMPGDPETWLALRPSARFQVWLTASASAREALLDAAMDAGDPAGILLALRGHPSPPERHAEQLRSMTADPWLTAALLQRGDGPALAAAREALRQATTRPAPAANVHAALDRLPPTPRLAAVLTLMEELDCDGVRPTMRALGDRLPEGADRGLAAIEAAFPDAALRWPTATAWIEARHFPDAIPVADLPGDDDCDPFELALALAEAVAQRHIDGEAGGVATARRRPDGTILLGDADGNDPKRDLFDLAWLLVENAVGRLPQGGPVRADDLVVHLAQLLPDALPEWVAVLSRTLSEEPGLRPRNGLDLWEQLACAQASAQVRARAPLRARAGLEVGHDTHIGAVKARTGQTNQDALFWDRSGPLTLLVVADGISVSNVGSGDLASGLLVQVFADQWAEQRASLADAPADALGRFLVETLATANATICSHAIDLIGGAVGRHIPMGTTAVVALIRGDDVHLAALGDSRAYLVGAAGAALLTGDQNLRGEWFKGWQKGNTPELINEGYALVSYCGHFNDSGEQEPVPPAVRRTRLLPGEVLVLCSDGVPDYAAASPAECAILMEEAAQVPDVGAAARMLVQRANAGGGGDNITVVIARQHQG